MQKQVKELRITVEAVYDDGYVVQKLFSGSRSSRGQEPEDAVEDFDEWIEKNMDLDLEEPPDNIVAFDSAYYRE